MGCAHGPWCHGIHAAKVVCSRLRLNGWSSVCNRSSHSLPTRSENVHKVGCSANSLTCLKSFDCLSCIYYITLSVCWYTTLSADPGTHCKLGGLHHSSKGLCFVAEGHLSGLLCPPGKCCVGQCGWVAEMHKNVVVWGLWYHNKCKGKFLIWLLVWKEVHTYYFLYICAYAFMNVLAYISILMQRSQL